MITFSVIIPTLSEEDRIGNLLTDIKRQSLQPNEIIIADKSTDNTPRIAKNLGCIVIEGVNDKIVGKARNTIVK